MVRGAWTARSPCRSPPAPARPRRFSGRRRAGPHRSRSGRSTASLRTAPGSPAAWLEQRGTVESCRAWTCGCRPCGTLHGGGRARRRPGRAVPRSGPGPPAGTTPCAGSSPGGYGNTETHRADRRGTAVLLPHAGRGLQRLGAGADAAQGRPAGTCVPREPAALGGTGRGGARRPRDGRRVLAPRPRVASRPAGGAGGPARRPDRRDGRPGGLGPPGLHAPRRSNGRSWRRTAPPAPALSPDAPRHRLLTSGSTGAPKAVVSPPPGDGQPLRRPGVRRLLGRAASCRSPRHSLGRLQPRNCGHAAVRRHVRPDRRPLTCSPPSSGS
ncbi:hypothetical protein LT493_17160 [Streptomyces tricolor]|nr:hypothetical protein [Streptomyces tricolor]